MVQLTNEIEKKSKNVTENKGNEFHLIKVKSRFLGSDIVNLIIDLDEGLLGLKHRHIVGTWKR